MAGHADAHEEQEATHWLSIQSMAELLEIMRGVSHDVVEPGFQHSFIGAAVDRVISLLRSGSSHSLLEEAFTLATFLDSKEGLALREQRLGAFIDVLAQILADAVDKRDMPGLQAVLRNHNGAAGTVLSTIARGLTGLTRDELADSVSLSADTFNCVLTDLVMGRMLVCGANGAVEATALGRDVLSATPGLCDDPFTELLDEIVVWLKRQTQRSGADDTASFDVLSERLRAAGVRAERAGGILGDLTKVVRGVARVRRAPPRSLVAPGVGRSASDALAVLYGR